MSSPRVVMRHLRHKRREALTAEIEESTRRLEQVAGLSVPAVDRSGKRPELMPADVEMRAADVSDTCQAIAAAEGAATVYRALNLEVHQRHEFFPELRAGALARLVFPQAKADVEIRCELTRPFVVDFGRSDRDLGVHAILIEAGLERTVQ